MAKSRFSYTSMGRSSRRSVERTQVVVRQSYFWPDWQLNFWILIMLTTGGVLVGVFASFVMDQVALDQGIPWIMPYGITVGAINELFIVVLLALVFQRRLLPGVVIIISFIFAVLYLAGFIETAIQLFGSGTNIHNSCQRWVDNEQSTGLNIATLVWLTQNSICQSWYAVFAFWIVGFLFMSWMVVLGSQVAQGGTGEPV